MARKTHLDVTSVTLISTDDYLGTFEALDVKFDPTQVNAKGVYSRYQKPEITKKKATFSIENMLTASGTRKSALDMSVFTVGGTDYLGALQSLDLNISTVAPDGSGVADVWEYPYAVGTEIDGSFEIQIASAAALTALLGANDITSPNVTIAATFAGAAFSVASQLASAGHSIKVDGIQTERISFKPRGTPSISGNTILALILTGTAQTTTANLATGAKTYSGTCLLVKSEIKIAKGQLIKDRHEFQWQGTPTLA